MHYGPQKVLSELASAKAIIVLPSVKQNGVVNGVKCNRDIEENKTN